MEFGLANEDDIIEVEDCPVCLDPYYSIKTLECSHKVHMKCIIESGNNSCPLCRRKIKIPKKFGKKFEKKKKERIEDYSTRSLNDLLRMLV